jgi:hypothetical protein
VDHLTISSLSDLILDESDGIIKLAARMFLNSETSVGGNVVWGSIVEVSDVCVSVTWET